jgi:hypothetical protein
MAHLNTLREALGLEPDDESRDDEIKQMTAMDQFRLVMQWEFGDPTWAEQIKDWMEECGFDVQEIQKEGP